MNKIDNRIALSIAATITIIALHLLSRENAYAKEAFYRCCKAGNIQHSASWFLKAGGAGLLENQAKSDPNRFFIRIGNRVLIFNYSNENSAPVYDLKLPDREGFYSLYLDSDNNIYQLYRKNDSLYLRKKSITSDKVVYDKKFQGIKILKKNIYAGLSLSGNLAVIVQPLISATSVTCYVPDINSLFKTNGESGKPINFSLSGSLTGLIHVAAISPNGRNIIIVSSDHSNSQQTVYLNSKKAFCLKGRINNHVYWNSSGNEFIFSQTTGMKNQYEINSYNIIIHQLNKRIILDEEPILIISRKNLMVILTKTAFISLEDNSAAVKYPLPRGFLCADLSEETQRLIMLVKRGNKFFSNSYCFDNKSRKYRKMNERIVFSGEPIKTDSEEDSESIHELELLSNFYSIGWINKNKISVVKNNLDDLHWQIR